MLLKTKPYIFNQERGENIAPLRASIVFLTPEGKPQYAVFDGGICRIAKKDGKFVVPSVGGQTRLYDFDVEKALRESADFAKFEFVEEKDEEKVLAAAAKKETKAKPLIRVVPGGSPQAPAPTVPRVI